MLYCAGCELCSSAKVPFIMLCTDYIHSWAKRCFACHLEVLTLQE